MKIISLFNHKGGVSKTTTTFNLGWMLAEQGHKTLIVDADPQCNLTALVLDYNSIGDIEGYYKDHPQCDLSSGLNPVMLGEANLAPGNPCQTANKNLFLYCGNLALSEIETQISVALSTSRSLPAMRNLPGSIGQLLRITGKKHKFEYILIDMNPSVGALNQCLLMSSDYFIVPTSPDFFCVQAIKSLSNVLPKWNESISQFREEEINYRLPLTPPKFLGIISQKYRPRNAAPARSFQQWIDIIQKTVKDELIPVLEKNSNLMTITEKQFKECVPEEELYNLANIADFNSLIAQSQKYNVPVFNLSDEQIEQAGSVLETMQTNREKFKHIFSTLAKNIVRLSKKV